MDRLTLSSTFVLARRSTAPLRAALVILALSFVVFLLTRGAQASVTRPHRAVAPISAAVLDDASVLPWATYIPLPHRQNAHMRCTGSSSRPKLNNVHPCADVYDAALDVHVVAGSLQPE